MNRLLPAWRKVYPCRWQFADGLSMRTNIDLDDALLEEVRRMSDLRTKKVVDKALETSSVAPASARPWLRSASWSGQANGGQPGGSRRRSKSTFPN